MAKDKVEVAVSTLSISSKTHNSSFSTTTSNSSRSTSTRSWSTSDVSTTITETSFEEDSTIIVSSQDESLNDDTITTSPRVPPIVIKRIPASLSASKSEEAPTEYVERFVCPHCTDIQPARKLRRYKKHLKSVHKFSNTFVCIICGDCFFTHAEWAAHKEEVHKGHIYRCNGGECGETFYSEELYKQHRYAHRSDPSHLSYSLFRKPMPIETIRFKCDKCSLSFSNVSSLIAHASVYHKHIECVQTTTVEDIAVTEENEAGENEQVRTEALLSLFEIKPIDRAEVAPLEVNTAPSDTSTAPSSTSTAPENSTEDDAVFTEQNNETGMQLAETSRKIQFPSTTRAAPGYACHGCPKRFEAMDDLINHWLDLKVGRHTFTCLDCDHEFASFLGLQEHRQVTHLSTDSGFGIYPCLSCDKHCATLEEALNHC